MDDRDARALGVAIRLRLDVRTALDRDDWQAVRTLNRAADGAYTALSPAAARRYLDWVRDDINAMGLIGGGDA